MRMGLQLRNEFQHLHHARLAQRKVGHKNPFVGDRPKI